MDYNSFLKVAIERGTQNPKLKKAMEDAKFQKAVYTGLGQEYILDQYRTKESKNQKEQRKRINISRTKHKSRQIENVIDQLEIMSAPSINVINPNKNIEKELNDYVYTECLSQLAFDYVKYYNLTDSMAFATCGVNEFDEIEYKVFEVNNIYDFKVTNKKLKLVVIKSERESSKQIVNDYHLYTDDMILTYENTKGRDQPEGSELVSIKKQSYYVSTTNTKMMFAFRLGFKLDMTNNQETTVSLMDSASELWKSLIWQGSELDVIDATHGIIQKREYVDRCGFRTKTDQGTVQCDSGLLMLNGTSTGKECERCNKGLITHTSSQDVLFYAMPKDPDQMVDLSKRSHTTIIPLHLLEYKKESIKETEEEIIKTIFNSSMVTKDEIAKTATEKTIDLQGIYATLNQIGNQVSQCFSWMVKCASYIKYQVDSDVIHGYTLSLKLEDIQSLSAKRKALIESNAPSILIKAVDMAMVEKENMASPVSVERFNIWESLRPFGDKTTNEVQAILSTLPDTFRDKVLYNFFSRVRRNIDINNDKQFYNGTIETRKKLVDDEVDEIIKELEELDNNKRVNFEGLSG